MNNKYLMLLAKIIEFALHDLFRKPLTIDDISSDIEDKQTFLIKNNAYIESNRKDALEWFKYSELFKLSGLDFEYLKKEYKKIYPNAYDPYNL